MSTHETADVPVRRATIGPGFHFFGYYDKTPWSPDGSLLLTLESDFMDRRPGPEDVARVCAVDAATGQQRVIGETRAWNWQQGAMLQWLPGSRSEAIFNDREGDRFVARIVDVETGATRTLPMPVYAVSPNGREAVSLSFSRLFDVRPGYGYAGVADRWVDDNAPADDGLWRLDLATGDSRLILSLRDAAQLLGPAGSLPGMDTGKHRFNHAQYNTDGSRFGVLHRWSVDRTAHGAQWLTRLLSLAPDGGEPRVVTDHRFFSHYDWRDERRLIAWARREGVGDRYYLFDERAEAPPEVLGEGLFATDGHCSYSPDRRWVLTDTYPDREGYRTLILFDPAAERRVDIGRFRGPNPADAECRCDLHPRWSRDGRRVCIDSIHEGGERQMYVLDVSGVVSAG